MPKNLKGGPLGFFNFHSAAKHQKIEEGKVFDFRKKSHNAEKTERGDSLGFFNIHSAAKHQKIEERKNFRFPKKSHNAGKTERGTLWDFQHPFCVAKHQKIEGGTLCRKKFSEKRLAVPKKIEWGDSLVSPGMICSAGKQEKTFWFSSPNGAI